MKEIFEKIWKLALPYQDKRDDKGHAEITLQYALKLFGSEGGNEDVIVPAIILHDIGWSQLTSEGRMTIFGQNVTPDEKLEVRLKHQEAGVELGRGILNKINYPKELIEEILEIVSQHDTREGFISKNEGLVRDADKLWRFSKTGFNKDLIRYKFGFQQLNDKLINKIKLTNFFYSEKAEQIAREELEKRRSESE
jgi:HD superfamily phosphodiesterase